MSATKRALPWLSLTRRCVIRRTPRETVHSRRFSSSRLSNAPAPALAVANFPASSQVDASAIGDLLTLLKSQTSSHSGHDAALVLATPGFTKFAADDDICKALAQNLAPSTDKVDQFNLLFGIVDAVACAPHTRRDCEGVALMRGSLNSCCPQLWESSGARTPDNKHDMGSIGFHLEGVSAVTMPLARTTFRNGLSSTLVALRYQLGSDGPKLIERRSVLSRDVLLPRTELATEDDRHLRLPLQAVTPPRKIAESFGNILRRVEVNGKSVPASTELEKAINSSQDHIDARNSRSDGGFPGIWAMVSPASRGGVGEHPWTVDSRTVDAGTKKPVRLETIQQGLQNGGRLFKLLSGGGGWGDKAGLLSLDPDTSPLPPTEEEQFANLFGSDDGTSSFAPVGAEVQFFMPDAGSYSDPAVAVGADLSHAFTFGVVDDLPPPELRDDNGSEIQITQGVFGVSSEQGFFVADPKGQPFKVNMPGSLLNLPYGAQDSS
ncbi:uncharacterized protein F5Z01DRAFT_647274 [Emericellopsis atlantica]|uniref:Uncharacterized protein n=1 Tax=Emericellopsis atlantica TaxID=2614577 RepID=A0A9P7ZRI5_9HYPO|nr:uncharacterized protein F5Z01DRAFT_647274 [Emericellopsis atlantica]KAG9256989.1 hypothetical protein F5Z01DRAFT_647274 [Emericellopsis atlantica]